VYEHDDPDAVVDPHPSGEALSIVGAALHGLGVQLPDAVQTPFVHEALGVPVNPDWQAYMQLLPEFVVGQDGATVFAIDGALVPVHCARHVPVVVHCPGATQVAESVPVNPLLHAGVQGLLAAAVTLGQVPRLAFAGGVYAGQENEVQLPTADDQVPVVHVR